MSRRGYKWRAMWQGSPRYIKGVSQEFSDSDCRARLVQELESTHRRVEKLQRDIEDFDKGEFFAMDRAAKGLPKR
jgi:hypothetical protein